MVTKGALEAVRYFPIYAINVIVNVGEALGCAPRYARGTYSVS